MACYFSQLHDHIHEPCLALFLARQAIDSVNVLFEHAPIPLSLHVCQTNINVYLLFCETIFSTRYKAWTVASPTGEKILLDIALHTTKKEWAENFVKRIDYLLAFLLIDIGRGVVFMQEGLQIRIVDENFRANKIK